MDFDSTDYPTISSFDSSWASLTTRPLVVSGQRRPWGFGFGYGVAWVSFIMITLSTALLICDRESEEIFYKEKIVDDDEEEEEEEEA